MNLFALSYEKRQFEERGFDFPGAMNVFYFEIAWEVNENIFKSPKSFIKQHGKGKPACFAIIWTFYTNKHPGSWLTGSMFCFLFLFLLHYFPWRWLLEMTGCVHSSSAVQWLVQRFKFLSKRGIKNKNVISRYYSAQGNLQVGQRLLVFEDKSNLEKFTAKYLNFHNAGLVIEPTYLPALINGNHNSKSS